MIRIAKLNGWRINNFQMLTVASLLLMLSSVQAVKADSLSDFFQPITELLHPTHNEPSRSKKTVEHSSGAHLPARVVHPEQKTTALNDDPTIIAATETTGGSIGFRTRNRVPPPPTPPSSPTRHFPDTSGRVMVLMDEINFADNSQTQLQWFGTHYVGSQKMTTTWTTAIRVINPNFLMLHYQLGTTVNPTAQFLDGNNWINDFPYVTTQNSWFYQASGQRVMEGGSMYLMDLTFNGQTPNSGWPAYWVQTALQRMRDEGADGVFADTSTVDTLFGNLNPAPTNPAFSTSVSACQSYWIPSLDSYWTYVAGNLHSQPEHFLLIPNMGGFITGWDTTNYLLCDGGMNENFANEDRVASDWVLEMNHCMQLTSNSKILLAQSYLDTASDTNLRWFDLGSYLLVKGHFSYFDEFDVGPGQSPEWFPEYDINLGSYLQEPTANVSQFWNASMGVYKRDFQNGSVLVNPSNTAVTANVGSGYNLVTATGGGIVTFNGPDPGSLSVAPATSVTVPAWSACVILKTGVVPTNTANRVGNG